MNHANIFFEPHEHDKAARVFADQLSEAQLETILNAPEGSIIQIQTDGRRCQVRIIEEG